MNQGKKVIQLCGTADDWNAFFDKCVTMYPVLHLQGSTRIGWRL